MVPNNVESEPEAEVESPKEKKTKPKSIQSHENSASRAENVYVQSPDLSAEMLCLDTQPNKGEPMFPLDRDLISSGSLGHLAMYESEWTSLLVKWKFQGALVLISTGKDMTSSGDAHRPGMNRFSKLVAEYLILNIRSVLANGLSKPTYIRFLTGLKAYSQIFSICFWC
ncbi:unnamed protein product [Camellia sinensis]